MLTNIDDRAWLEPPDYDEQAVFKCCECACCIFEGYDYYDIFGTPYCEDCADDNFKKCAEKQDWEE